MAKRPSTARKTLSAANLSALGADRLAALLIEVVAGDANRQRRLRLELAAEVGAPDLALELDKRLNALAISKARVSWRKRPDLIDDLQTLRRMMVDRLAPVDAKLALDRLVAWFDLYPPLSVRVKDPKGELAAMFDAASADLASVASLAGPEVAGPILGEALATRLSEWASWVGRGASGLSRPLAQRLLTDLTRGKPQPTGRLALVVRKLADRSGDLDAWLHAIPEADRGKSEVGAEVARRLAQAGRAAEARVTLEASRIANPSETWSTAEIAVLEAEGRADEADEARWLIFERTLSADQLRTLVAGLPDFEDVVALDRAFAYAAIHPDAMAGLSFLMNWPAPREAAALVTGREGELRGAVDDVPLWAARLQPRYPAAALSLLRARARALVRLGAGMDDEVHGLIGEAEALAVALDDDLDAPSHAEFVAEIEGLAASAGRGGWRRR